MSTMDDMLALLCKVHNEKILDKIKRKYPGIDQILTPEKIAAYDRGEYDDLDVLPPLVLSGSTAGSIVKWHHRRRVRQWVRHYEAELISRYKAGLL